MWTKIYLLIVRNGLLFVIDDSINFMLIGSRVVMFGHELYHDMFPTMSSHGMQIYNTGHESHVMWLTCVPVPLRFQLRRHFLTSYLKSDIYGQCNYNVPPSRVYELKRVHANDQALYNLKVLEEDINLKKFCSKEQIYFNSFIEKTGTYVLTVMLQRMNEWL